MPQVKEMQTEVITMFVASTDSMADVSAEETVNLAHTMEKITKTLVPNS